MSKNFCDKGECEKRILQEHNAKLRAALRSAEDILIEEREVMGAHPDHWKIANALDRAINRINRLS